jgi:voltage-gated potassium channel
MNIKHRLYLVALAILLVILTGSLGYYVLFGGRYNFTDCLYMTVISITSVGFGEVLEITGNLSAEIFTMVLITFGMGIILYGISTVTALLIEGELSGILRRNKMNKLISKLSDHYIICGGGETGGPLIAELQLNKEKVVLVEKDDDKIERCQTAGGDLLFVKGDATEDQNLITAGIDRAAGIVICLPSDKENLYIAMTARMLNKKIRIVSRMTNPKLEKKLIKAGANSVVSPNAIGALRMASVMIRPTVVNFLDSMLRSTQGQLRVHQIIVSPGSNMTGKKIMDSGLKDKFNLLVLGSKENDEEIAFNPSSSQLLTEGMTLIVMGDVEGISKAKKAF